MPSIVYSRARASTCSAMLGDWWLTWSTPYFVILFSSRFRRQQRTLWPTRFIRRNHEAHNKLRQTNMWEKPNTTVSLVWVLLVLPQYSQRITDMKWNSRLQLIFIEPTRVTVMLVLVRVSIFTGLMLEMILPLDKPENAQGNERINFEKSQNYSNRKRRDWVISTGMGYMKVIQDHYEVYKQHVDTSEY